MSRSGFDGTGVRDGDRQSGAGRARRLGRIAGGGVLCGVAAYALGLLGTFALLFVGVGGRFGILTARDFPWLLTGWVFYGAHDVPIAYQPSTDSIQGTRSQMVEELIRPLARYHPEQMALPAEAFYLVPVVLLGLGGLAVASYLGAADDPARGVVVGASTVLGYLPMAVAGMFLFTTVNGDPEAVHVVVRPDPVRSVLLAGLAYPLVVGGVGGAVGTLVPRPSARTGDGEGSTGADQDRGSREGSD